MNTTTREDHKLVVIGWDAATWDLLTPWVEAGELPNLARLMARGSWGRLQSTPLPLSPAAWSTIVTGQNPGKHCVFDWFERKPGSYAVEYVHTGCIAAKTLWQYFNAGGKRVGIFNLPMVYPAAPIEGFMLSGMAAPNARAAGFAYPPELLGELEQNFGPYPVAEAEVFKVGREGEYLRSMLDWLDYQRKVVRYLITHQSCDAYLFVFMQSDHVQHKFWRYLDSPSPYRDAILRIYRILDEILGELLEVFGERVTFVLLSDHGAGACDGVMYLNRWLRQEGLLYLRRHPLTWLKYALAKSNLILRFYRLASTIGLGRLANLISKPARNWVLSSFLSFDDIAWRRTRAYARGSFGQIFVNLRGREPQGIVSRGEEYERLVGEILVKLRALSHPESGEPLITDLRRRAEGLSGPYLERAADVLFSIQGYRYQSSVKLGVESSSILGPSEYEDSGSHRMDGILVMAGPGILPGLKIEEAALTDVLPTLLALADLPIPQGLDGRPLAEVFTPAQAARVHLTIQDLSSHQESKHTTTGLDNAEQAQLEERLRSLGYLG